METHFFITAITRYNNQIKDCRCWGYSNRFEEAEKAVLNDDGIFHEAGTYNYIVIEEMHMACWSLPTDRNQSWYEFDYSVDRYKKISKPKWSGNIMCWGIG